MFFLRGASPRVLNFSLFLPIPSPFFDMDEHIKG